MPDAFHYTIRTHREADTTSLLGLIADLQDSLRLLDALLPRGADMASRYLAQTFEQARQQAGVILVAEIDEQLIGYVVMMTRVPFAGADEPEGEYAYVTDLGVGVAWRHRGIGSSLLAAAEHAARENGAREMRLLVLVGNPARELYRRAGFHDYSIKMRKRLDAP